MKTAIALFSNDEKQAIEAAIATAEKLTAGEIVPIVATTSGRYDRAEDLFGLLFALLTLSAAWLLFQGSAPAAWSATPSPVLGLPVVIGIVIGGFIVGTALATRFPALRLPLIARREMIEEVDRRAHETFQRQRLSNTANSAAVLIYVSLYEHVVKVVSDEGVAVHLSSDSLEEICALVADGLKHGRPADGLSQAVIRAGELLASNLPAEPGDVNEIANRLILID